MHEFSSSDHALVLFSGGQDSTICLLWALNRFSRVHTVGFAYGQRHQVEMDCRRVILEQIPSLSAKWGAKLATDTVLPLEVLADLGHTALIHDGSVAPVDTGLPASFVPGRNLLFLITSAALGWKLGCRHIISGISEEDSSGYPDCRDDTAKALQVAVNLGMDTHYVFHTPLMWLTKAQTWLLAQQEGAQAGEGLSGADMVEFVRTMTHTCYEGDRSKAHGWGYGCGSCAACVLRRRGWEEAQDLL